MWNNHLGSEEYGNILYLISIMNIIAISVGSACNYARMTESATKDTWNINYNIILMASSVIVIPVMLIIVKFCGVPMTVTEAVTFLILTILTMWRLLCGCGVQAASELQRLLFILPFYQYRIFNRYCVI